MNDRREGILARLVEIFSTGIPGVVTAARNRTEVSGKNRPALFIHDAAEDEIDFVGRPGRPNHTTKNMMSLTPQIYILIGEKSDVVGTRVSEMRRAVIAAIWNDDQLWNLVGATGDIRYTGCGLDTSAGESREARLEVNFVFTYMLDVNELTD